MSAQSSRNEYVLYFEESYTPSVLLIGAVLVNKEIVDFFYVILGTLAKRSFCYFQLNLVHEVLKKCCCHGSLFAALVLSIERRS